MSAEYDYAGVVERLRSNQIKWFDDTTAILDLLGYEVAAHQRLGCACRTKGESYWQSVPRFTSADDAEMWIKKAGGAWNDIICNNDKTITVGYEHPDFGNDYGTGQTLGLAMWGAFVRLVGKVTDDD